MSYMNYGLARGLAYRENWEADMNREARHYQLQKQANAEKQQEVAFWAETFKRTPITNEFDRKGYEKYADKVCQEIADIPSKNPNWKYNVKDVMAVEKLKSQLVNNEYTVRDKKLQEQIKAWSEYHEKNPTDKLNFADEYVKDSKRIHNYLDHGNADSDEEVLDPVTGTPIIKEFDFVHPVEMNVLDEMKKLKDLKSTMGVKSNVEHDGAMYETKTYSDNDKVNAAAMLYQNNKGGWDRLFMTLDPTYRKNTFDDNVYKYIYETKVKPMFNDESEFKNYKPKTSNTNVNVGDKIKGTDYHNLWVTSPINSGATSIGYNPANKYLVGVNWDNENKKYPLYADPSGQVMGVNGNVELVSDRKVYVSNPNLSLTKDNKTNEWWMTTDVYTDDKVLATKLNNNVVPPQVNWNGEGVTDRTTQGQYGNMSYQSTVTGKKLYKIPGTKIKADVNSEQNAGLYNKSLGTESELKYTAQQQSPNQSTFNTPKTQSEIEKQLSTKSDPITVKKFLEKIRKSKVKYKDYKPYGGDLYGFNGTEWKKLE